MKRQPKIPSYSITKLARSPRLLEKLLTNPTLQPFNVTRYKKTLGTVVPPMKKYKCEVCGDDTPCLYQYRNSKGQWDKLILCDECYKKYVKDDEPL